MLAIDLSKVCAMSIDGMFLDIVFEGGGKIGYHRDKCGGEEGQKRILKKFENQCPEDSLYTLS